MDLQEIGAMSLVLAAAFGAVLSFLLERWKPLASLLCKVQSQWKPWVILGAIEIFALLPVLLKCVQAPEFLLQWVAWMPDPLCNGLSAVTALVIGFVAWASNQATFLNIIKKS